MAKFTSFAMVCSERLLVRGLLSRAVLRAAAAVVLRRGGERTAAATRTPQQRDAARTRTQCLAAVGSRMS